MINDQVRQLAHTLRVFGVHANFEARSNEAQGKGLSHLEFLKLLLEDEVMQRRERVAKSLTTRAKFRSTSDLEDWDQTFDRGLTKAKLRERSKHSFIESNENLLILGKTGEGKTHLAVAIGRRLTETNFNVIGAILLAKRIDDFGAVTGINLGYSPIGRPLMSVYCYLVDDLLIDTCASNSRKALLDALGGKSLSKVALTHYHEDHAGNAAFLKKQFAIPVVGHQHTGRALSRTVKLRPYEIFMWGKLEPVEVEPVGDLLQTERFQFQPIHTPGHSHDHLVYLEKREGWLFSGDMFLGPKIKYFRRDEDIFETIQSLRAILGLDFDKLFCGHNPQLNNPKRMIQRKHDNLVESYIRVVDLLKKGTPRNEVVRQLTSKYESIKAKLITLGDVSYKNMVLSILASIDRGEADLLGH